MKNLNQAKSTSARSDASLPVFDFNQEKDNFSKLPKIVDQGSEEPESLPTRDGDGGAILNYFLSVVTRSNFLNPTGLLERLLFAEENGGMEGEGGGEVEGGRGAALI